MLHDLIRILRRSTLFTCLLFWAPLLIAQHSNTQSNSAAESCSTPATSYLTPEFLTCMNEVGFNLPIHTRTCKLVAHHWDASASFDKWNEDIRFEPFNPPLSYEPLIMEVGGYIDAGDSQKFRGMFPLSYLHIYEPIPIYFNSINYYLQHLDNKTVHNHGLGSSTRDLIISTSDIANEATYIMDGAPSSTADADTPSGSPDQGNKITVHVVNIEDSLQEILRQHPGRPSPVIDVLHVNCEGCEWELFEKLTQLDLIREIRYIQISYHNYGRNGIGGLLARYCIIREQMKRTHSIVKAVPFGWERWQLKLR